MGYKLSIDMLLSICNYVINSHGKEPDDVIISRFYESLMKILNANKNESDSDSDNSSQEYIDIETDSDK
jgi:hypothetical protein